MCPLHDSSQKLRGGLSDLAIKSFMPLYTRHSPLTHTANEMIGVEAQTAIYNKTNNPLLVMEDYKQKGYFLIQDIWKRGTGIIHKMRVVNPADSSYLQRSM